MNFGYQYLMKKNNIMVVELLIKKNLVFSCTLSLQLIGGLKRKYELLLYVLEQA